MNICKSCGRTGTHKAWCTKLEPRRTHEQPCMGRHCVECTPTAIATNNERSAA